MLVIHCVLLPSRTHFVESVFFYPVKMSSPYSCLLVVALDMFAVRVDNVDCIYVPLSHLSPKHC